MRLYMFELKMYTSFYQLSNVWIAPLALNSTGSVCLSPSIVLIFVTQAISVFTQKKLKYITQKTWYNWLKSMFKGVWLISRLVFLIQNSRERCGWRITWTCSVFRVNWNWTNFFCQNISANQFVIVLLSYGRKTCFCGFYLNNLGFCQFHFICLQANALTIVL